MNTPHRESAAPDTVSYAEYQKVCAENAKLRDDLASVNRWGWVRELPRKAGLVSALMACLAIVFYAIWFCTLRGVAWGERARHNAEREALVHATRQYGLTPTSTVCDAEDTKGRHGSAATMTIARCRTARRWRFSRHPPSR